MILNFESIYHSLTIQQGRIDATVWSSDYAGVYAILINEFGSMCSCPAWQFRGSCKHIQSLAFFLVTRGYDLQKFVEVNKVLQPRLIPTGLRAFDLLFGGLPVELLFGYYGAAQSGKSLMMSQFSYAVVKYQIQQQMTGRDGDRQNVLILDTEGGMAEHFLSHWVPRFNKRFEMDMGLELWQIDMKEWIRDRGKHVPFKRLHTSKKELKIIVLNIEDLSRLFLLHGRPMPINYGKKLKKDDQFKGKGAGKVTPLPQPEWNEFREIWETPLAQMIEAEKICCLIYDSLTQPIDAEGMSSSVQSFPGRATASMVVLGQAQKLTKEYGLVTMVSHHPTRDPTRFETATPTGGKPVGHNFKKMAYIKKGSSKDGKANQRILQIMRHPTKPKGESMGFMINDSGIHDI